MLGCEYLSMKTDKNSCTTAVWVRLIPRGGGGEIQRERERDLKREKERYTPTAIEREKASERVRLTHQ